MPRRPSRVALVQAPAFHPRSPSGGLALLLGHLKAAGYRPSVHDVSLELHRRIAGGLSFEQFHDLMDKPDAVTRSAIDEQADLILAQEPDLVGFSVVTYTERWSLELARRIKTAAPRCVIMFGGPACLREDRAFEFIQDHAVDAVAAGEADHSLVDFLGAWEPGRKLPTVPGLLVKVQGSVVDGGFPREFAELDALPYSDFGSFDLDAYSGGGIALNASRGCVRKCAFCTHIVQEKVFRLMSPSRVVAEIRHQLDSHPQIGALYFTDSLVNGNTRWLGELSNLLLDVRAARAASRRPFKWRGMAIVHPTMTSPLLQRMNAAGCDQLFYGLESGSQKVVDAMGKHFKLEDAEEVIRSTRRAGILPGVFVLVGFPGETEGDFQQTLAFLERNASSLWAAQVSPCTIEPGSALAVHPEAFGVRATAGRFNGWTSADGTNTPEVRRDRLGRAMEHIGKLGLVNFSSPADFADRRDTPLP